MPMKKLKKIKLEKVNGGVAEPALTGLTCPYCGYEQNFSGCNTRTKNIDDCDDVTECQCNKCKQWYKYNY